MKLINSWKSIVKQHDKYHVELRLSIITLLKVSLDFSNKEYSFVLFNFGLRF